MTTCGGGRRRVAARPGPAAAGGRRPGGFDPTRLDPVTVFHVHLTDTTLLAGVGVVRVEELGPLVLAAVRDWLTHPTCPDAVAHRVTLRPVLDTTTIAPVDRYEMPPLMAEASGSGSRSRCSPTAPPTTRRAGRRRPRPAPTSPPTRRAPGADQPGQPRLAGPQPPPDQDPRPLAARTTPTPTPGGGAPPTATGSRSTPPAPPTTAATPTSTHSSAADPDRSCRPRERVRAEALGQCRLAERCAEDHRGPRAAPSSTFRAGALAVTRNHGVPRSSRWGTNPSSTRTPGPSTWERRRVSTHLPTERQRSAEPEPRARYASTARTTHIWSWLPARQPSSRATTSHSSTVQLCRGFRGHRPSPREAQRTASTLPREPSKKHGEEARRRRRPPRCERRNQRATDARG